MADDRRIGRYRIERPLGEGGTGRVYLARDEKLHRPVAIKMPRQSSREAKERFLQEARTAAVLNHPAIVTIYEIGETDETTFLAPGTPFIVMQYIEGQSLQSLLEERSEKLPYPQIAQMMVRVSEAVHYAHTRGGLVHRDLKPSNILIGVQQEAYVADFGLAAYKESLSRGAADVAGTQEYMAPEQICGATRDGRTDIWSLGVILYRLLTGQLPFSPEAHHLSYDICYTEPVPPQQIDDSIPKGLQEVCLKCLSKDVTSRYQTAEDLADGLRPFLRPGRVWTIPLDPTPCFIGREEEIAKIREILKHKRTVIVTGVPGIGKTQIAIQYAERYKEDYEFVLWADASTPHTVVSHLLSLASVLNLPVTPSANASLVLDAVHHWLRSHDNWLLILDNVEELTSVQEHLPTGTAGHMLLTSCNPVVGGIESVTVGEIDHAKGTLLLLRRAGLLASTENLDDAHGDDAVKAKEISQTLDGLPLALDQAGAFMEEMPCGPAEYMELYESRGARLRDRRGDMPFGHPLSIATTFAISFARIKEISPIAADLLCVFSFLSPESIPEELILKGAPYLGENIAGIEGDQLALLEAVKVARRFSLIQRTLADKTLSIHRLVQDVLQDRMDLSTQKMWAERTVQAISMVFPDPEDCANWPSCDRLLPHILKVVSMIERWHAECPESAQLLGSIGYHLLTRGRYAEAEPIFRMCVELGKRILGLDDPDVAVSLSNLASALYKDGRREEAEPLYRESLRMLEAACGSQHLLVASALDSLGALLAEAHRMDEAERLQRRALEIEEVLSASDRRTANTLSNLSSLLTTEGRFAEAEGLIRRALAIDERLPDGEHPDVATHLRRYGSLLIEMKSFCEAKPLLEQALAIDEKSFGSNHPEIADSLNTLAGLLFRMSRYEEAEPLLRRAVEIERTCFEPDHHNAAAHLSNLGILLTYMGKTEEAEPLLRKALEMTEARFGGNHPDVADFLTKLARSFFIRRRYEEAESLLQRALRIDESSFGLDSPRVADRLSEMASFLCDSGRYTQAKPLLQRSLRIRETSLGADHPKVAADLRSLAGVLMAAEEYEGVEQLLRRALEIFEKRLGKTNPITTDTLRNLGAVLDVSHRQEEARVLMQEALKRDASFLGRNHTDYS